MAKYLSHYLTNSVFGSCVSVVNAIQVDNIEVFRSQASDKLVLWNENSKEFKSYFWSELWNTYNTLTTGVTVLHGHQEGRQVTVLHGHQEGQVTVLHGHQEGRQVTVLHGHQEGRQVTVLTWAPRRLTSYRTAWAPRRLTSYRTDMENTGLGYIMAVRALTNSVSLATKLLNFVTC